jgi:geranylgeranyl pyrophosphate synthase
MAAGQAMDLTAMNDPSISGDLLMEIYRLKTSKLFAACLELGRLASPDDDEINQRALQQFGDTIGLAFQIQDDVLDMEATTESLGKPQNHDEKNHKITYPKVYGLESAKVKVNALYLEALEAIDYLGNQAQLLRELMQQMLERKG